MPFLTPLTHFCQMIYFFKFTLIKSTQWNNLRFFPKACTRVFNNIKYWLQCLQIGAFQQHYLNCKCETPYFEGELVHKTCKNWKMSFKHFFLSGLVTKQENPFVFGKNLWKISSNGWFQKKLLTDLTSAGTLKVCFMRLLMRFLEINSPPHRAQIYILFQAWLIMCICIWFQEMKHVPHVAHWYEFFTGWHFMRFFICFLEMKSSPHRAQKYGLFQAWLFMCICLMFQEM